MKFSVHNLRHLGGGGFGQIFLAEHSDTGETVVVKYLIEAAHPQYREQFARELRVLLGAAHRGIIRVLDWSLDCARPFYVMPYFKAGPLLKRVGSLSHADSVAYGAQIAGALASMHAAELFHGDLKPDNILMDGLEVRVGDPLGNGAGCTISFGTKTGGTHGYMAPEIVLGGEISEAGDVYAFGATLFHMATGQHPHRQPDLDPARIRPALHPTRLSPGVDPVLRTLVLQATQPNPERRPSMQELRDALTARHGVLTASLAEERDAVGKVMLIVFMCLAAIALVAILLR